MDNFITLLPSDTVSLIIKLLIAFLIGLYTIFVLIIFNHIRSLKRIVIIEHASGSPFIQSLALLYLLFSLFLFVAAVVIL